MSAQTSALQVEETGLQIPLAMPSQDAGLRRLRMTWFLQGMGLAALMMIGVAALTGSPAHEKPSGSEQPSGSEYRNGLGYPYGMGFNVMPAVRGITSGGGLRSTPMFSERGSVSMADADQKRATKEISKFPYNAWSPSDVKASVFMVAPKEEKEEAKTEEKKAPAPVENENTEITPERMKMSGAPPATPKMVARDNSYIPTAADIAKMDDPWGKRKAAVVHDNSLASR